MRFKEINNDKDDTVDSMAKSAMRRRITFAPVPEALQNLIALGGNRGWLKDWWDKNRIGSKTS